MVPFGALNPPQLTALQQILVSTAIDRAAASMAITDSNGFKIEDIAQRLGKTFVEDKNFYTFEAKYALHAIKRRFLDLGVAMVDNREQADSIMEVSIGALGLDAAHALLGLPALNLPVPLVGNVETPEMALYKESTFRGLAKIAVSIRDMRSGKAKTQSMVNYGTAKVRQWIILLVFEYSVNDLMLPKEYSGLNHTIDALIEPKNLNR